ncbi:MAG: stage II sporulation protein M [Bacillota bacterium]
MRRPYFVIKRPTYTLGDLMRIFLFSSLRRCWFLYVLAFIFFAAGFTWGVQSAYQLGGKEAVGLEDYATRLVESGAGHDRGAVFRQAAVRNVVPVMVIYAAGLTMIAVPVVAGVLFLRGYALGFTSSLLVRQKGVYGLGVVLAEIFPQNMLMLVVLLVAAVASFSFFLLLLRRWFDRETAVFPWFLRYTAMTVLMVAMALGAGLVEAYVVPGIAQVILPVIEE